MRSILLSTALVCFTVMVSFTSEPHTESVLTVPGIMQQPSDGAQVTACLYRPDDPADNGPAGT